MRPRKPMRHKLVTCLDCQGTGVRYPSYSISKVPVTCRTCGGTGYHDITPPPREYPGSHFDREEDDDDFPLGNFGDDTGHHKH